MRHPQTNGFNYEAGLGKGFLSWALLLGLLIRGDSAVASMNESLQQKGSYFLSHFSDYFKTQTDNTNSLWLKSFLSDAASSVNRPQEDWVTAFYRIVSIGRFEYDARKNTGFVEDKEVLSMVAAALGDKDTNVKNFAVETLLYHAREVDLKSLAQQILAELNNSGSSDSIRLMALLPLDDSQKSKLMGIATTRKLADVLARLGDSAKQDEVISNFQSERKYAEKAKLARTLGYIGSRPCAEALVKGLKSDVAFKSRYEETSIRRDVLLALGRIYQDEPLFTKDARLLADNSDETFDRIRGLASYTSEVNAWTQKNFSVQAWDDGSVWFVRFLNTPIIQPKS